MNMVRRTISKRKRQFKAAVSLAGTTVKAWCEQEDISPQHLNRVLRGDWPSERLTQKVDAFIAHYLPHLTTAA